MELKERLRDLAEESGYDFETLVVMWGDYVEECRDDGECASWEYFKGVIMEHDW